MKNRRCIILLVLLIISVAVNFYFIREGERASPCDDKDLYSKDEDFGVLRLTEQQASDYVRRYREEYPPDQNNVILPGSFRQKGFLMKSLGSLLRMQFPFVWLLTLTIFH